MKALQSQRYLLGREDKGSGHPPDIYIYIKYIHNYFFFFK